MKFSTQSFELIRGIKEFYARKDRKKEKKKRKKWKRTFEKIKGFEGVGKKERERADLQSCKVQGFCCYVFLTVDVSLNDGVCCVFVYVLVKTLRCNFSSLCIYRYR